MKSRSGGPIASFLPSKASQSPLVFIVCALTLSVEFRTYSRGCNEDSSRSLAESTFDRMIRLAELIVKGEFGTFDTTKWQFKGKAPAKLQASLVAASVSKLFIYLLFRG